MGKGLKEFDQDDAIFSRALLPRVVLTALFTAGWYSFAKCSRVFNSNQSLVGSVPVAALLSFYFTRGMAYHYVAACDNLHRNKVAREIEHEHYRREVRRNLVQH